MNDVVIRAEARAKHVDGFTKTVIGELIAEVQYLRKELQRFRNLERFVADEVKNFERIELDNKAHKEKLGKADKKEKKHKKLLDEVIAYLDSTGHTDIIRYLKKQLKDDE
jgi:hypothetical protein